MTELLTFGFNHIGYYGTAIITLLPIAGIITILLDRFLHWLYK